MAFLFFFLGSLTSLSSLVIATHPLGASPNNGPGDYIAQGLQLSSSNDTTNASASFAGLYSKYYPWTLSDGGSGSSYASECSTQWSVYNELYNVNTPVQSLETRTFYDPTTEISWSTYKLCDGVPRARVTEPTVTSTFTTSVQAGFQSGYGYGEAPDGIQVETSISEPSPAVNVSTVVAQTTEVTTGTFVVTSSAPYATITPPPCRLQPADCTSMWRQYSANSSGFEAPPCLLTSADLNTDAPQCHNQCTVEIQHVDLIYFPVTLAGDVCGNQTTLKPNATTPRTIESLGTTFTEGTAYLSYSFISAMGYNPASSTFLNCGTVKSSSFYPVPSSELKTYSYEPGVDHYTAFPPEKPFDFADLAPNPVPASAYRAQPNCHGGPAPTASCSTIVDEYYAPYIVIPSQVWQMNSLWSDCSVGTYNPGMYDPPMALTEAASEVVPTAPGGGSATGNGEGSASPEETGNTPGGITVPRVENTASPTAVPAPAESEGLPSRPGGGSQSVQAAASNTGGQPASSDSGPNNAPSSGPPANEPAPSSNDPSSNDPAPSSNEQAPGNTPPANIPGTTVNGQAISQDPSHTTEAIVGSRTLTAGGAAVTISGTEMSLGSNGVVIGGSTTVGIQAQAASSSDGESTSASGTGQSAISSSSSSGNGPSAQSSSLASGNSASETSVASGFALTIGILALCMTL